MQTVVNDNWTSLSYFHFLISYNKQENITNEVLKNWLNRRPCQIWTILLEWQIWNCLTGQFKIFTSMSFEVWDVWIIIWCKLIEVLRQTLQEIPKNISFISTVKRLLKIISNSSIRKHPLIKSVRSQRSQIKVLRFSSHHSSKDFPSHWPHLKTGS